MGPAPPRPIRKEFAKIRPNWRQLSKRPKLPSTLPELVSGKGLAHHPRRNS